MDVDGGSVQTLATVPGMRGGTWNQDGTILFSPSVNGTIFRIPATGGEPSAVTKLGQGQLGHRFPHFLPDGHHFMYFAQGTPEVKGVYIGQIDGPETRRLMDADSTANYASNGYLLFIRQGALFAQKFDLGRLALKDTPFLIAEQVAMNGAGGAALSVAAAGSIAYHTGSLGDRQFVWFDRSGKEIEKIGNPDGANPLNPSLSPDGRFVGMYRGVNGNQDIWLLELARTVLRRFTSDPGQDQTPIWSPDGSRIVFTSSRKGPFDLYIKPVASGNEELLLTTPLTKGPTDWSPDGRFLLYRSNDPKTGYDLWALNMDGDRKPFPVVQTEFDERDGQFSPDAKWIAYQSDESSHFEVYVQPFPGPGRRVQISTNGGAQVRWRRDGRELFYVALDEMLMAVPIRFSNNGQEVEPGAPIPLFTTHIGGAIQGTNRQQYVASAEGRFLLNELTESSSATPITLILNWHPQQNR
jgi:hypothetical protein